MGRRVFFLGRSSYALLLGSYRGKALTFPSPPLPFETRRLVPPEERIRRHIVQEVAGMIWLSTYFPILNHTTNMFFCIPELCSNHVFIIFCFFREAQHVQGSAHHDFHATHTMMQTEHDQGGVQRLC